jgi:hypothetical protein
MIPQQHIRSSHHRHSVFFLGKGSFRINTHTSCHHEKGALTFLYTFEDINPLAVLFQIRVFKLSIVEL